MNQKKRFTLFVEKMHILRFNLYNVPLKKKDKDSSQAFTVIH
jgi:hypothetical protein